MQSPNEHGYYEFTENVLLVRTGGWGYASISVVHCDDDGLWRAGYYFGDDGGSAMENPTITDPTYPTRQDAIDAMVKAAIAYFSERWSIKPDCSRSRTVRKQAGSILRQIKEKTTLKQTDLFA